MHEALAIVRKELGMDAVILHTRHVTKKRFLPFLKRREQVEITASVGVNVRQPVAAAASGPSVSPGNPAPLPAATFDEPVDPVSRAAALAAELGRRNAEQSRLDASLDVLRSNAVADAIETPVAEQADLDTVIHASEQTDSPSVAELSADDSEADSPPPSHVEHQAAGLTARMQQMEGESATELVSKIDSLQKMVESLTRSTQMRAADEIPSELFDIYTQLIDADIEDDLARELTFALRKEATPEQLHDPVAARSVLSALVEREIQCANPIRPEAGRRRVVALVGPTGVGKTTTIAKLAANFRLRDGIHMGLVTVDTYRIAAVEQLRTYAEIIDLPMKVVTSPQEMRRALDELEGMDLILIDTAGRSPRDELKIQELKQLLNEAAIDEVHLVMSLTASVRSIRMTCEQFAPVKPTALILTKLDEAAGMGSLLSLARQVELPVSYLTTGQDVPEDIEPANKSRISRLVLGQDRLFDRL
jgi:flagellar biosynthesis protein FlhF